MRECPSQLRGSVYKCRLCIEEAKAELDQLLTEDELKDAVVLVFANKQVPFYQQPYII